MERRMDKLGSDFDQRYEYEAPQVQARMRNLESSVLDNLVLVEQNIDIQASWALGGSPLPAEESFNSETFLKQVHWPECSLCLDNLVEEPVLIFEVNGFRGVDRRSSCYFDSGPHQKFKAQLQIMFQVTEIRPQTQIGSM